MSKKSNMDTQCGGFSGVFAGSPQSFPQQALDLRHQSRTIQLAA